MPGPEPDLLSLLLARIGAAAAAQSGMLVVGICGAQGSGKSTLCAALAEALGKAGLPAATLSLDDLYLTRAQRQKLAHDIHPLLATRGVPGTHDVALGLAVIAALDRGEPAALPRFDKGTDDRAPDGQWSAAPRKTRVLLLEGWCLGALPQSDLALVAPVNQLEATQDPEGVWRDFVNAALAGPYQGLFSRIDQLYLLAAPGWDCVAQWREEAEAKLRRTGAAQAMSTADLTRFIQHYERLTRWILAEMPGRANVTFRLGHKRELLSID